MGHYSNNIFYDKITNMYKITDPHFNSRNSLLSVKLQKTTQQSTRIIACCILALALFSCSTVSELSAPIPEKEDILPTIDTVEPIEPVTTVKPSAPKGPLEVSVAPEEYYTGLYHYSAEYPTFIDYPELTKQIEDCVQAYFAQFDKLSAENYQAQLDTTPRQDRAVSEKSSGPPYSFFVRWEHEELSQDFISIKLETYQYAGGANGMTFIDTFNYYPTENRFLTIEDIPSFMGIQYTKSIWLDYLSNNSRFLLENQINRDKNTVISDMISQGTTPQVENFEHFTIQNNNITLWFQEYHVAAGSFGTLSITLPLEN